MFTLNKNHLEGSARETLVALRHVKGIQNENIMNLIFLYAFLWLFYHSYISGMYKQTMLFTGDESSPEDLKVGNAVQKISFSFI